MSIYQRIVSFVTLPLAVILVASVMVTSCRSDDQRSNTSVRLKLKNSGGEMIYLDRVTVDGTARIDSGRVDRQGEVTFHFYTSDFDFLLLGDGHTKPVMLLAEKGEDITVYSAVGEMGDNYSVRGSGGSSLLHDLEQKKVKTVATLDSIGQVWLRVRYDEDNMQQKELLDSVADGVIDVHREWLKEFIERYQESPATIIAVYQTLRHSVPLLTFQDHLPVFTRVTDILLERYPGNPHVIDLQGRHDLYVREYEAYIQREKRLQPGMPAPEISLVNLEGERVRLSDLEGKYVLLHFWDGRKKKSWETNSRLKELYSMYRYRGLEIMGIYVGDDRQMFSDIIGGDQLPWIHLFSNTGVERDYNVLRKEPQMVLVGRDGKILQRPVDVDELALMLPRLMPSAAVNVPTNEEPRHNSL